MRARDVAILVVASVILVFGWSQEGAVSFKRGFSIPITDTAFFASPAKPLLVDLFDTGSPVLITSPEYGVVALFETQYIRSNLEDQFIPLTASAAASVSGRVMALGAGPLQLDSRNMTLFAISADAMLTRLSVDSAQREMQSVWSVPAVPADYGFGDDVEDATVTVLPLRVNEADEGLVVVAVPVRDANDVAAMMFAAFNGGDGSLRWRVFSDMGNAMDEVVEEAADTALERTVANKQMLNIPGEERIFGDGLVAQREDNGTAHMQPWQNLREAIVAALPHRYAHSWDSRLRPHRLYKAKTKRKHRGRRQQDLSRQRTIVKYDDYVIRTKGEDYGALGEKLRDVAKRLAARGLHRSGVAPRNRPQELRKRLPRRHYRHTNALVYHGPYGMEVIHLFTGSIVTRVLPLQEKDVYYHDVNDDFNIDGVGMQLGARTEGNGEHEAAEVVDCLGTIVSGAPEAADMLYNATICDTQGVLGQLNFIHSFVDGDLTGDEVPRALNTLELLGSHNSGTAHTHGAMPLVVQTHVPYGHSALQVERLAVFMIDSGLVTCVNPSRRRVMWRTNTNSDFGHEHYHDPGDHDAARAAPRGRKQQPAAAGGGDGGYRGRGEQALGGGDGGRAPHPHLAAYSPLQPSLEEDVTYVGGRRRYDRVDPYVLAVGVDTLTAISTRNGRVAAEVALPLPPTAPVMVVDFNGDGTNDVIVMTGEYIYGLLGARQASAGTLSSLLLLTMAMLALLFAARGVVAREKDPAAAEGDEEAAAGAATAASRFAYPSRPTTTFKRATD